MSAAIKVTTKQWDVARAKEYHAVLLSTGINPDTARQIATDRITRILGPRPEATP